MFTGHNLIWLLYEYPAGLRAKPFMEKEFLRYVL